MIKQDVIDFSESIAKKLLESEIKHSERTAIQLREQNYSYQELFDKAKKVAILLKASNESCCLILTARSISAYVAILAVLLAGKAYVFLNRKESIERIKKTILLTDSHLVITDETNQIILNEVNQEVPELFHLICLNTIGDIDTASNLFQEFMFSNPSYYCSPLHVYKYAYLMFTSGSTGEPKGVPISNENLSAFLTNILDRIKPDKCDKFAHVNELTFDFSVYELFSCWLSGACLCVLPDNYLLGINKFIINNEITFWSSVPSLINLLKKLKKLDGSHFKSIRYSLFCGEPLTYELLELWNMAAPNSIIDNIYGPTESTVAITGYIWDGSHETGIVPIGIPFNNQKVYLLNSNNEEVEYGDVGEICLAGSQVCETYWNNDLISSERFITVNERRLYKTGDLAYLDDSKGLCFKGRVDDQLKIKGYRVEKVDIEHHIKSILETQSVAVIAAKNDVSGIVNSLTCFFSDVHFEVAEVTKLCRQMLPGYMLPTHYIKLQQLPYNKNGKIDYSFLSTVVF